MYRTTEDLKKNSSTGTAYYVTMMYEKDITHELMNLGSRLSVAVIPHVLRQKTYTKYIKKKLSVTRILVASIRIAPSERRPEDNHGRI